MPELFDEALNAFEFQIPQTGTANKGQLMMPKLLTV